MEVNESTRSMALELLWMCKFSDVQKSRYQVEIREAKTEEHLNEIINELMKRR